jgi:uncharacterized protein YcaQ
MEADLLKLGREFLQALRDSLAEALQALPNRQEMEAKAFREITRGNGVWVHWREGRDYLLFSFEGRMENLPLSRASQKYLEKTGKAFRHREGEMQCQVEDRGRQSKDAL